MKRLKNKAVSETHSVAYIYLHKFYEKVNKKNYMNKMAKTCEIQSKYLFEGRRKAELCHYN